VVLDDDDMAIRAKLVLVAATRPNFMKVAPVVRALLAWNSRQGAERNSVLFDHVLVHTGQHYDRAMSDVFFEDLGMSEPNYYLDAHDGSPVRQCAQVMVALEPVLLAEQPDLVIVVGDVNSTLAAALTAAKMDLPVAHVEAGLRSRDRGMPEETNRILTDALSELLFATCADAIDNLAAEGVESRRVEFVGNPMIDTLMAFREKALQRDTLTAMDLSPGGYALVTLHRPSNVDDPIQFQRLCEVIAALAQEHCVVFPVHTRTRMRLKSAETEGRLQRAPNLHLTGPLGYLDFVALMAQARLVITDSGGVQEETTALGVPCLTVRTTTERPVTVTEGTNTLVNPYDQQAVLAMARNVMDLNNEPTDTRAPKQPALWDGHAADRIVTAIAAWIGHHKQ
jgi:UDP-N-acetylglucosamine 2-epimerase (non-hydrolysing)